MIHSIIMIWLSLTNLSQQMEASGIIWEHSTIDTTSVKSTCPCYYIVRASSKIKNGLPLNKKPLTLSVEIEGYSCSFANCSVTFSSGPYPLLIIDRQQIDYSGRPTIEHTGNHSATQNGIVSQRTSTLRKTLPDCLPPTRF